MPRDIIAAAATLKDASPEDIQMYAKHDWDMIREVAAVAFAHVPRPKVERRHHADCELRGDGPCYCEQGRADSYYR